MRIEVVFAQDLARGMILMPVLRSIRYKRVERIISDGMEFERAPQKPERNAFTFRPPGEEEKEMPDLRQCKNHEGRFVIVQTDCGPVSFRPDQSVKVLCEKAM
jgi:hypothetical protein